MDRRGSLIIVHASAFFAPILVPIIFMLISNEREVKNFSIQALLFHFMMCFCLFISFLLSFVLIGIPLLLFFAIVAVWCPIKGVIYAAQDRPYDYPIVGNWVGR